MDPIADMLTAIRNALAAQKAEVIVPASKVKTAILAILAREGYVKSFRQVEEGHPATVIELKYNDKLPAIGHLRRISKPGLRVYRRRTDLPRPLRGMGIAILSTPSGVITDKEARKLGVGGEVICEVW